LCGLARDTTAQQNAKNVLVLSGGPGLQFGHAEEQRNLVIPWVEIALAARRDEWH